MIGWFPGDPLSVRLTVAFNLENIEMMEADDFEYPEHIEDASGASSSRTMSPAASESSSGPQK